MKNDKNTLTIALSPECCGGWKNSLKFMEKNILQNMTLLLIENQTALNNDGDF